MTSNTKTMGAENSYTPCPKYPDISVEMTLFIRKTKQKTIERGSEEEQRCSQFSTKVRMKTMVPAHTLVGSFSLNDCLCFESLNFVGESDQLRLQPKVTAI